MPICHDFYSFDNDQTSLSYGMGDRYHWAWGLIDFGNGTFQGAAHGLAASGPQDFGPTQPPEVYFWKDQR